MGRRVGSFSFVISNMQKINLKNLLNNMIEGGIFNRVDLVPRYLAVGEQCGDNDYGWSLYLKMMWIVTKGGEDPTTHHKVIFSDLIDKARHGGFDTLGHPLVFKSGGWRMADGAHRLAAALYCRHEDIYLIHKSDVKRHHFITIDWFREKEFTDEEIELIVRGEKEMLGWAIPTK